MSWYKDKRVFITGGSSGIGRALALRVKAEGAHVSIAARGQQKLDETLAELDAIEGGSAHAISVDVSDLAAVRAAAEEVIAALGGIDVVVANAGVSRPGRFLEIPDEEFPRMIDINYHGVVNVVRAFMPTLLKQGHGNVCIVSSILGYLSVYGYTAYAASKYAVVGFAEALRQEVRASNITVSVSYPADTDTPQLEYENQFKPAQTKALNAVAGLQTAEHAARTIAQGVARGKADIYADFGGWFLHRAVGLSPGLVRWVIALIMRRAPSEG